MGAANYKEEDDYPDIAVAVAKKVSEEHETARGILICGSGVGVDVVANKFMHIRSALVGNADQAFDSRNDDDSNILCLGANYLESEDAKKITTTWLETPFSGEERHRRRIEQISQLELKNLQPTEEKDRLSWK